MNYELKVVLSFISTAIMISTFIIINFTTIGNKNAEAQTQMITTAEEIIYLLENEQDHWVVRTLRVTYFPNKKDAKRVDKEGRWWPETDNKAGISLIYGLHEKNTHVDRPYEQRFNERDEEKVHKAVLQLIVNRIKENWDISYKKQKPVEKEPEKKSEQVIEKTKDKNYL